MPTITSFFSKASQPAAPASAPVIDVEAEAEAAEARKPAAAVKMWRRVFGDAVAFYNWTDVKEEFPLPRMVALHNFSFPLSQACVERIFNLQPQLPEEKGAR